MTKEENANLCEECSHELRQQSNGDFYCPSCDSCSGFTLTPSEESFEL